MIPAKIVGFVSGAVTSAAIGKTANTIAPRETLYPTPKRLATVVAAAVALEYAITGIVKLLSKRYGVDVKHVV